MSLILPPPPGPVIDAVTGTVGGIVADVLGLPSAETLMTIAGNVVIGLAGGALLAFGAITALSATKAGKMAVDVAVTAITKGKVKR